MGRLFLVRHGQTAPNAAGLIQGQTDPELTAQGRQQAAALAPALPVETATAVISSPLRRARQTAEALGGGRTFTIDPRWIEIAYGEFEGGDIADVRPTLWANWEADPTWAPPGGGESLAAVAERVASACDELAAATAAGDVIVVTHVNPIKLAVTWALGTPPQASGRMFVQLASITTIEVSPAGHPVLLGFSALPAPGTGGTEG